MVPVTQSCNIFPEDSCQESKLDCELNSTIKTRPNPTNRVTAPPPPIDSICALVIEDLSLTGAVEMLREGHKESQPIRYIVRTSTSCIGVHVIICMYKYVRTCVCKEVAPTGGSLGRLAERLRRAGCDGRHKQNIERDLLRTLTSTLGCEAWLH